MNVPVLKLKQKNTHIQMSIVVLTLILQVGFCVLFSNLHYINFSPINMDNLPNDC